MPISKTDVATEAYNGINTACSRAATAGKSVGFHDSTEGVPSEGSWRQTDHHSFSLVHFWKFWKFCRRHIWAGEKGFLVKNSRASRDVRPNHNTFASAWDRRHFEKQRSMRLIHDCTNTYFSSDILLRLTTSKSVIEYPYLVPFT